jgi:Domain of unknown function DUF1828
MNRPCELINQQLGALFTCEPVGEFIRIETPFLYPDGDILDIFYQQEGKTIHLTDLGETLHWLKMQTTAQRKTSKQIQLISDICLIHDVKLDHGALVTQLKASEELADALMKLSQAMLRVSDLALYPFG